MTRIKRYNGKQEVATKKTETNLFRFLYFDEIPGYAEMTFY